MQRTAVYWVVYTKTQSSFMLGVAVFAAQFPSFLLSLMGGVVADRFNRYRVLLITQVASMIQAVLLTILVLLNRYSVWEVLSLSVVLGIINAFDVPARQSMIYEMVDAKENLPNAIALNSSMVNLARLIGPALAGLVLEKWGAGICFLLNAASFVAVIISLLLMRLPTYIPQIHSKKVFAELKDGLRYLKQNTSIGFVILQLAFISLLVLPFITLLPVYAKVIFKGTASTFGYLNSCIGLGAVGGAFFLASLKYGSNLKKVLFINTLIFGAALILFSHMTRLPFALLFVALSGFGMMSQTTISNTLIQTTVAPSMRGRVISYFAMAFFGMQPLGSLLIGVVSQHIAAPDTILGEGIAAVLIAILFLPFLRADILKRKHAMKLRQLEEHSIEAT